MYPLSQLFSTWKNSMLYMHFHVISIVHSVQKKIYGKVQPLLPYHQLYWIHYFSSELCIYTWQEVLFDTGSFVFKSNVEEQCLTQQMVFCHKKKKTNRKIEKNSYPPKTG